jgi:mycothiol synthase
VTLRPPTEADAAGIVALMAPRPLDEREVLSWFENPALDVASDFRVLEREGRIVAYADVHAELDRLALDWAGERDELDTWAQQRARELGVEKIRTWAWSADEETGQALAALGYRLRKRSYEMRVGLDHELELPMLREGVSIRPARMGEEPAIHVVVEEAFSEGEDFRPTPFDEWIAWVRDEAVHDRSTWFVAEDGGELAGAVVCRVSAPGEPHVGWVDSLAVRKPWRRNGLGNALLRHAFEAFRVRGRAHAGLSVTTSNPTGAVQLYERAGMRVHRESATYEKELG